MAIKNIRILDSKSKRFKTFYGVDTDRIDIAQPPYSLVCSSFDNTRLVAELKLKWEGNKIPTMVGDVVIGDAIGRMFASLISASANSVAFSSNAIDPNNYFTKDEVNKGFLSLKRGNNIEDEVKDLSRDFYEMNILDAPITHPVAVSPLTTDFTNIATKQANFAKLKGLDRVVIEFEQITTGTKVLEKTTRIIGIGNEEVKQDLRLQKDEYLLIKCNYDEAGKDFDIEFNTDNAPHLTGEIRLTGIYAIPNFDVSVTEVNALRDASQILLAECDVEVANQDLLLGAFASIRGAKNEEELSDDKVLIYKFIQDSDGTYKWLLLNGKVGASASLGNLSDPANVMKVTKHLDTGIVYNGYWVDSDGKQRGLGNIQPRLKNNNNLDDWTGDFKGMTALEYSVDSTTYTTPKKKTRYVNFNITTSTGTLTHTENGVQVPDPANVIMVMQASRLELTNSSTLDTLNDNEAATAKQIREAIQAASQVTEKKGYFGTLLKLLAYMFKEAGGYKGIVDEEQILAAITTDIGFEPMYTDPDTRATSAKALAMWSEIDKISTSTTFSYALSVALHPLKADGSVDQSTTDDVKLYTPEKQEFKKVIADIFGFTLLGATYDKDALDTASKARGTPFTSIQSVTTNEQATFADGTSTRNQTGVGFSKDEARLEMQHALATFLTATLNPLFANKMGIDLTGFKVDKALAGKILRVDKDGLAEWIDEPTAVDLSKIKALDSNGDEVGLDKMIGGNKDTLLLTQGQIEKLISAHDSGHDVIGGAGITVTLDPTTKAYTIKLSDDLAKDDLSNVNFGKANAGMDFHINANGDFELIPHPTNTDGALDSSKLAQAIGGFNEVQKDILKHALGQVVAPHTISSGTTPDLSDLTALASNGGTVEYNIHSEAHTVGDYESKINHYRGGAGNDHMIDTVPGITYWNAKAVSGNRWEWQVDITGSNIVYMGASTGNPRSGATKHAFVINGINIPKGTSISATLGSQIGSDDGYNSFKILFKNVDYMKQIDTVYKFTETSTGVWEFVNEADANDKLDYSAVAHTLDSNHSMKIRY